jgi:hypothetical protein
MTSKYKPQKIPIEMWNIKTELDTNSNKSQQYISIFRLWSERPGFDFQLWRNHSLLTAFRLDLGPNWTPIQRLPLALSQEHGYSKQSGQGIQRTIPLMKLKNIILETASLE